MTHNVPAALLAGDEDAVEQTVGDDDEDTLNVKTAHGVADAVELPVELPDPLEVEDGELFAVLVVVAEAVELMVGDNEVDMLFVAVLHAVTEAVVESVGLELLVLLAVEDAVPLTLLVGEVKADKLPVAVTHVVAEMEGPELPVPKAVAVLVVAGDGVER